MASNLTVTGCSVDTNSITISFSDKVDQTSPGGSTSALDPGNYTIYDPAAGLMAPQNPTGWSLAPVDEQTVKITAPSTVSFNDGDWVLIEVSNIGLAAAPGASALDDDPQSIARRVPGAGTTRRVTRDVEDAISYPILTEEIGYRPSPVGIPMGGGGGGTAGGSVSNLGQVAMKAVGDVLGWKPTATDPRGFLGALTQSFTLTDIEGHVESKWTPRTYAVQTDLGGGITGAQASLYTRAKDALDQSLSLLDGLYPLDPEADPEYVKALREMARSQMTQIVNEFGVVGLPSILRIDTYFNILLGQNPGKISSSAVQFDPDEVKGTLGELRDIYGIQFVGNKFNNSVEDEQDITNFRMISDYMTSLMQSWMANRQFFLLDPKKPAFFGTQLVLISRQFNVIAETVNEVRFTLDSVFIGPNERQTLLLDFAGGTPPPMFIEDVLKEVERFATEEGPRLLRDGGKISVKNNIRPVMESLEEMVNLAHNPTNINDLPDGYRTARVQNSLDDLEDQIEALIDLIKQIERDVPPSEEDLAFTGISTPLQDSYNGFTFTLFGRNFTPGTKVSINSSPSSAFAPDSVVFVSAERLDVKFNVLDSKGNPRLTRGTHDVIVTNDDGEEETLDDAFQFDGKNITAVPRKAFLTGAIQVSTPSGTRPAPPAPSGPPGASTADVSALNGRMDGLEKSLDSLGEKVNKIFELLDRDDKNKKK